MAIAAFHGATDLIEYLLDNSANPDVGPTHEHPLTAAAGSGQARTDKKLLAHGVDLAGILNSSAYDMRNGCGKGSGKVVGLLLDEIQALGISTVVGNAHLLHDAVKFC